MDTPERSAIIFKLMALYKVNGFMIAVTLLKLWGIHNVQVHDHGWFVIHKHTNRNLHINSNLYKTLLKYINIHKQKCIYTCMLKYIFWITSILDTSFPHSVNCTVFYFYYITTFV